MSRLPPQMRDVRLAVFDIDGVFTDGRLWVGTDGTQYQPFHVRDGHGVKRLMAAGVAVAIISGRESAAVTHRMRELGVREVRQGVADKAAALGELLARLAISPGETVFVGDDEPDLPAMALAGYALSVADAHPEVRAAADWITRAPGGAGAVREICDLLVAQKSET